jgi:hypothetical protein
MSFDLSQADAIMKETYAGGVVPMDYKGSKTLLMIRKNKGTLVEAPFGAHFNVPVKHGNPQAGGADYAQGYADARTEQSRYSSWAVTPGTFWHWADVGGDITRRGSGAGSFVDALTKEIENSKMAMRRMFEIMLFRGGWGDLGQLSATAAVGSATGVALQYKWMVRMFEKGIKCVFSASEAANVLKGVTPAKVTGRHAAAGTLDFDIAPNTAGTAAAVSDFIFRIGDRQNSATPVRQVPVGFKAWLPTTAPSSTLFFNVNRTVDDRLGGLRQDAAISGSPEEAFMDGNGQVDAEGGQITHWVMGRDTFTKVCKSLSNHIEYCDITTDVGIGIPGFRLNGSDAVFYWDSACEEGLAYGFNIDEIELRYAGEDLFTLETGDGMTFRRVPGFDAWRAEIVTCSQLIMPAPGHSVVVFGL